MNMLFMGAGGLLDFDATLPLMAIQFILFLVVLTLTFYMPTAKTLEKREEYSKHERMRLNTWLKSLSSKIDSL
jgi:type II secretory pathway component PulM